MGKLATFFVRVGKQLFGQILLALGISVISYTGINIGMDYLKDYLIKSFNGFPSDAILLCGVAGVGNCIGLLFGTFTAIITLNQSRSFFGKIKK